MWAFSVQRKGTRPTCRRRYDIGFWRHERFWKLLVPQIERQLAGTPWKNLVSRMLGVRTGRRGFDDDVVEPDSFVMKGEQVPAGSRWGGNPAEELPDAGHDRPRSITAPPCPASRHRFLSVDGSRRGRIGMNNRRRGRAAPGCANLWNFECGRTAPFDGIQPSRRLKVKSRPNRVVPASALQQPRRIVWMMATGYERLVLTRSRADAWVVTLRGEPSRESTQALRDEIDELLDRRSRQPVVVNLAAGWHAHGDEPVEASYQELVREAVAVGSELCVICAPEEPSLTMALLCCRNTSLRCTSVLLTH